MGSLLVRTSEGELGCDLVEGGFLVLADGQRCWIFTDGSRQILTRVGVSVELRDCLNKTPDGLVLEFGVASGTSIRILALSGRKVYGFDWWKGIPHEWNEADAKGTCLSPKPNDLPENVTLVEGLFGDTLEPFLKDHPGAVAFVHIDCDLYCPTVYVLHCLRDRFVAGSVIAFDEIDQGHYGEKEAWARYLKETEQNWEFLGKQKAEGEVYRMVDTTNR